MAYELKITHSSSDQTSQWLSQVAQDTIAPRLNRLSTQLIDWDHFDSLETAWLHAQGGVRGVTMHHSDNVVTLSLSAGANDVDWDFLLAIALSAAEHEAAVVDEEGETIENDPPKLTEIIHRQKQFYWNFLQSNPGITLPIGGLIPLVLEQEVIDLGEKAALQYLADQMQVYAQARLANVMPYGDMVLALYEGEDILIDQSCTHIIAEDAVGRLFDIPIPKATFMSVFENKPRVIGEFTFFPALDIRSQTLAYATLKLRAIVAALPESSSSAAPEEVSSTEMTESDWMILAKAPILIFFTVAAADGKVSKKELKQFDEILQKMEKSLCDVTRKVVDLCMNNVGTFLKEFASINSMRIMFELGLIGRTLNSGKLPIPAAASLKHELKQLAHNIANASGGLFGFGSKISKEEQESLNMINEYLEKK